MNGDLIGVNTDILSGSGTSSGVGFAIPAALARQVVMTALGGGHSVIRPWLGVRGQALTGEMARSLGLASPQGVVAADIWPGGPAARAGITSGDVIVQVNGAPVNDPTALNYSVATLAPGAQATLLVRRAGGAERTVTVRLEAPPDTPAKDETPITGANPLNGAVVINLSPAAAEQLGLDPFAGTGVAVEQVQGGYAARLVQPGDFIRRVNGQTITNVAQLTQALSAAQGRWVLVIDRGGQLVQVQIGM